MLTQGSGNKDMESKEPVEDINLSEVYDEYEDDVTDSESYSSSETESVDKISIPKRKSKL